MWYLVCLMKFQRPEALEQFIACESSASTHAEQKGMNVHELGPPLPREGPWLQEVKATNTKLFPFGDSRNLWNPQGLSILQQTTPEPI
jgi:hypothetical protein